MRCVSVCLVGASAFIILCGLAGAKTASSIPPPGRAARAHEAIPTSETHLSQSTASSFGSDSSFGVEGDIGASQTRSRYAGDDTLWIFDADFEDLEGDNAGWVSVDRSGFPADTNYWHKDTIRINGFTYLGDSTWWCGTNNPCWLQPRGYGNNWRCDLSREFALGDWSNPGDPVTFEWDQRYAMERNYDYGYVDVSTNGGASWTTIKTFTNGGVTGSGQPRNWNHSTQGHITLNMNTYAGHTLDLRFRFASDSVYSAEDMPDNPLHPVKDGAWQLDNFKWKVNGGSVWYDDCESPGSNGWVHDDIAATGQAGIVFQRVYNPDPLRTGCWLPHRQAWWMAAVDAATGRILNDEFAALVSPPIDISGADRLVGEWTGWVDCPTQSDDAFGLDPASSDDGICWEGLPAGPSWWYGGPNSQQQQITNWTALAGSSWLRITWLLAGGTPTPPEVHWTGFMLDRQRVGVPIGGPPTIWDYGLWTRFHDWFAVAPALADTASVSITDDDGIASVYLVASNDGGNVWEDYPLERPTPGDGSWHVPPPVNLIGPASEIHYYFESTDSTGVTRTLPQNAPDAYFEFSILPIVGGIQTPGILLVDKHGRATIGETGEAQRTSEYYFREALDVLGHEYDVYDVQVPAGSMFCDGPDTAGMKYYDTQIWFTSESNYGTVTRRDQARLISWLSRAAAGKERNLLLTGNDIGYELMEVGTETLSFYATWLGSHYVQNDFGYWTDPPPTLRDAAGGFAFMTHDDGQCLLWDG
jgi:hypothetical protein